MTEPEVFVLADTALNSVVAQIRDHSPEVEEWRSIGVFGPAVAVPPDPPLLDRLLGLTGRDPTA